MDANIAIAVGKLLTDPDSLNSNESARVTTVLAMSKKLTVTPTTAVETKNLVLPITTIQAGSVAELPKVIAKMAQANVGNGNLKDQTIVAEVVLSVPVGGTVEFATADKGIYNKLYLIGVGDPAKAQGANRQPFSVGIEGRILRVIPVTP